MADTKTYNNVSEATWTCVKTTSIKENGTVYSGPNQGTATTNTIVGTVILGYNFVPTAQTLTYKIQKKPAVVSQSQIWNGIRDAIEICQRRS